MRISQDAVNLIKQFEGFRDMAYVCPAGKLTIGYGHTGSNVKSGQKISQNDANLILLQDLDRVAKQIMRSISIRLNPNQFGAIVSLAFNCGTNAVKNSTLVKLCNKSQFREAADQFLNWDKYTNPKTGQLDRLEGLTRRRVAERALFLKPVGGN